jgi:DNA-3-methyladenine glycosylase
MADKLPLAFYQRRDVVRIARELLGKELITCDAKGRITSGFIVETEAYNGPADRACHAYNFRRTARTQTMYLPGGAAYVYLCYGMYNLFNVVTHGAEQPYAVLVRALQPAQGVELMLGRRKLEAVARNLTAGPGLLTQALGIDRKLDTADLTGNRIWIQDGGLRVTPAGIVASPRVGVAYAGSDAALPYRFRIKGNPWTSPAR